MTARALLERLTAEGVTVRLDGEDICLLTAPPRTIDKALVAELRAAKAEVVAELRRESDVLQYAAERGLYEAEWRVAGCTAFTVLEHADKAAEARCGACLACGASWPMHGSPVPDEWRCVKHPDDVRIVAVRFVLASAAAIARGTEQ
jgi:hypothetical protein